MPPPGTTLRNIRVDDDLWHRIGQAAQLDGTTRSDLIRTLMNDHATKRLTQAAPAERLNSIRIQ